ncbi:hypothetical protein M406DRAFT_332054 [Cryphonectria parasitica EP155]|uniref:Uncharacterized protein n=1 Tax=Cryphonectria parasitica (strain ATCC 38755 / EP155) TaxID=660469 RepID=A0A9P4XZ53_CRYP1|nr:uncharacterized protein M406DRAFT_332054 [Cryphonectria parasitica EP155]KAF3763586.1 hypothetical protein M406DRAFT_332054 [Cryphonectria parasitica EP155]
MALPWEKGTLFPEAYMTKVPEKIRRQERDLSEVYSIEGSGYPEGMFQVKPKFIAHESGLFYFDYGAVRLGRRPNLEDAGSGNNMVCVGLGWLPGWQFTVSERGLPDTVPVPNHPGRTGTAEKDASEEGVLGLVYQLVSPNQPTYGRSPFSKRKIPDIDTLSYATGKDWAAAVPFHPNLKVLKQVRIYLHVFDGEIGHRYQKDGSVVLFRTPSRPVKAVVHVDPEKLLAMREEPKLAKRQLQGEWAVKELEKWTKEAGLPREYVEKVMGEYIPLGVKPAPNIKGRSEGGLLKFLGFKT